MSTSYSMIYFISWIIIISRVTLSWTWTSRQMKHSLRAHSATSECVWILDQMMCPLNLCIPNTNWTFKAVNERLILFVHALSSNRLSYWLPSETEWCIHWPACLSFGSRAVHVSPETTTHLKCDVCQGDSGFILSVCQLHTYWSGRIGLKQILFHLIIVWFITSWFNFQCFSVAGHNVRVPPSSARDYELQIPVITRI